MEVLTLNLKPFDVVWEFSVSVDTTVGDPILCGIMGAK